MGTRRIIAAVFLFCGLAACRPGLKTPPDTLVIGIESAPTTLDPRLSADAFSSKITQLIHNGLFRLDERFNLQPDLLDRYEQVSPTEYRFHLKPGLRFQDGSFCDADDVVYTLRSAADPKLASPFRSTFEKVEKVAAEDALTVAVTLKEVFAPFLTSLTLGIIPAEGDPNIGTGPFALEDFRPAEGVTLVRNDRYFRGPPPMERVRVRVIPDDNLRVLELKNRRVDVLQNSVPPLLLPALKDDPNLVLETTEGINMTYLGMNLRDARLQKADVREAIARALDVPALIDFRMAKLARPATGLLAPVHWAYERDVLTYPYDPARSKELLDKAGLVDPDGAGPKPRFSLTYKTSTKKDRIGLARLIARYLKEVGIEVEVLPYDWGVFFSDVNKGNFQIYSLTWVGITEPDMFYNVFNAAMMPPAGVNRAGYSNKAIDELTEQGRRTLDQARRKEIYSAVQKVLSQEIPIIPLWYDDNYAVFGKNVKGLRLRPNASFEWAAEVTKE